jgi:hypothetical protein
MTELEKLGIPTVSITSRGYEADFRASSKVFGFPSLVQIVIPYTLTSRTEPQGSTDADEAFSTLVDAMITPPGEAGEAAVRELRRAETERFAGAGKLNAWEAFNREFLERGWGDGFPLFAPTRERVQPFLDAVAPKWSPLDVVGRPFPPGDGMATIEKIAINAAMAGCEPQHMHVLIAAIQAMLESPIGQFPLRILLSSHGAGYPLMLLNGPVVKKLGLATGMNAWGPGKPGRVNTTLGRAMRLIIMNVAHAYPEVLDLDTIGTAGKYSAVIAENEDANPWGQPFHVDRGFHANQSVVTMFAAGDVTTFASDPSDIASLLRALAARGAAGGGGSGAGGGGALGIPSRTEGDADRGGQLLMIGPEHARALLAAGYTKEALRRYMVGNAPSTPLREFLATYAFIGWEAVPAEVKQRIAAMDPETPIRGDPNPDHIHIAVIGGAHGVSEFITGPASISKVIDI